MKVTSFWSEGDVMVEELAELHGHVGETLRTQLCCSLRLVHRIRHFSGAHIHLKKKVIMYLELVSTLRG